MPIALLVTVAFAILFYRAAVYERMSGWVWAVASFAVSFAVMGMGRGMVVVILAQVALFGVMTWYNASRARK